MNSSQRAGWLVPFINRQTWTAVWAAALREPSVRAEGEGVGAGEDKRKEVGRGGLRPALTEERSESEACLLIGGMSYETSKAVSDCQ